MTLIFSLLGIVLLIFIIVGITLYIFLRKRIHGHQPGYGYGYRYDTTARAILKKLQHDMAYRT